jgi:CubicO group peptidase (beta-lactamase class C family)
MMPTTFTDGGHKMARKWNHSKYTAMCAIFFFLPLSIFAQGQSESIDQYVQAYHQKGLFDGAVLVAKSGEVIFKKGYGLANREWDAPFEPDTKMAIGSLTKSLTSLLVMQQVEMGRIKLERQSLDS